MFHFRCPLCGLSVPVSKFHPEERDNDIQLLEFSGLGRGKGFRVSESCSILHDDDELKDKIVSRVEYLHYSWMEEGLVEKEMYGRILLLVNDYNRLDIENKAFAIKVRSLEINELQYKLEKDKMIEELKEKERITGYIKIIKDICSGTLDIDKGNDVILILDEIDEESEHELIGLFLKIKYNERRKIKKRLCYLNDYTKCFFYCLSKLPEPKTVAERIDEYLQKNPFPYCLMK